MSYQTRVMTLSRYFRVSNKGPSLKLESILIMWKPFGKIQILLYRSQALRPVSYIRSTHITVFECYTLLGSSSSKILVGKCIQCEIIVYFVWEYLKIYWPNDFYLDCFIFVNEGQSSCLNFVYILSLFLSSSAVESWSTVHHDYMSSVLKIW